MTDLRKLSLQDWNDVLRSCGIPETSIPRAFRVENTHFTVARYYGGVQYLGHAYVYFNPYVLRQNFRAELLVRDDVVKWARENWPVARTPGPKPDQMELGL